MNTDELHNFLNGIDGPFKLLKIIDPSIVNDASFIIKGYRTSPNASRWIFECSDIEVTPDVKVGDIIMIEYSFGTNPFSKFSSRMGKASMHYYIRKATGLELVRARRNIND